MTNDDAGSGARTARKGTTDPGGCLDRLRDPLPTRVDGLPALPEPYGLALERGLAELGLVLDPTSRIAIDDHVRLLLAWNASINLTSVRDSEAIATRHVVDSLTCLPVLAERAVEDFVDVGSGGGFPGIPIAAALPTATAVLAESVRKKSDFLRAAVAASGLGGRVRVAASRVEALARDPAHRGRWGAATARAVASLPDLIELAFPLLARDGILIAWKRDANGGLQDEVAAAGRAATALGGGRIEVRPAAVGGLLPGHALVLVTRTGNVPERYPRDPAARRRQPW